MSRDNIRSTRKTAIVAVLMLAVLARLPFADGLLFHDHSDQGLHAHTVTLDDLHTGDIRSASHAHHHNRDDDSDSDRSENPESSVIFVNGSATATGVNCSCGALIASARRLSSHALAKVMSPWDSRATAVRSCTPWPSAHPLRPAFALDALLQSSHALLL